MTVQMNEEKGGKLVKTDYEHFADIKRPAMVGEKQRQQGMALFCKPFTKAAVR